MLRHSWTGSTGPHLAPGQDGPSELGQRSHKSVYACGRVCVWAVMAACGPQGFLRTVSGADLWEVI